MQTLYILLFSTFFLIYTITTEAQIPPGSSDNFITICNTMSYDFITIPTVGDGYDFYLYWEEVDNPENNGFLYDLTGNTSINGLANNWTYRIEISEDFLRIFMEEYV